MLKGIMYPLPLCSPMPPAPRRHSDIGARPCTYLPLPPAPKRCADSGAKARALENNALETLCHCQLANLWKQTVRIHDKL